MRLAFIYNAGSLINAQYRALMPMTMLRARGHEIVWYGSSNEALPIDRLRSCDLIHVYRAAGPRLLDELSLLKQDGVALSWDNDDDVTTISRHSPSYAELGGIKGQRDFRHQIKAIQTVNLVTTSSNPLAERFARAGARDVKLIENYLPPEFGRIRRKGRGDAVVVGWAGLREHEADVRLLEMDSVLTDVLEANPEVRVVTVGLNLGITHKRYQHRQRVPFEQLGSTLAQFDIGLAPLADIPFNRARSTIKLKEYAITGVPWLASPVGEYRKCGASQGGRLVADEDWREEIHRLINNRRTRALLRARGRLWARKHTIELQANVWEQAFQSAIQIARADATRVSST